MPFVNDPVYRGRVSGWSYREEDQCANREQSASPCSPAGNFSCRLGSILVLAGLLFALAPAGAHHSWPAVFKQDEEVVIEGVVTEFLLRNPHSWLFVEVADADGNTERWDVEMGPAMAFGKIGITKESFRPGDQVMILGNPGRQNPRWVHFIGLYRSSDGWVFGKDPRLAGGDTVGKK